jgi:ABC-2 type transport system permease protein
MMRVLFLLEWKNLFASRALALGHVLVFLLGAYGLYCGKSVIARQREVLRESPELHRERLDYLLATTDGSSPAGGLLFYLPLHTRNVPSAWAAFSLGQRDVSSFNVKVRLLTLEGQLYDSELTNPASAALGHFDAAFVLLFFLPLLVIASTHDLVSGERELGIWGLVRAQPVSPTRVAALKVAVRVAAVLGLALSLIALTALYLEVPLDGRIAWVAIVVSLYVLFWFGAGFLVSSLGRSSSWNAVALLGLWLATAVFGPSLANVAIATLLPVPEALEVAVRQRQGYHESWDLPQREVMAGFYRRYPEYAAYAVPEDRYSDGWYYAMNHRGDVLAEEASRSYRATLERRALWAGRITVLFPPVAAQEALDRVAGTDLGSHLSYLDSVRRYHEELKAFFYPIVFREDPVRSVDWGAVPEHRYESAGEGTPGPGVLALPLFAALLFALGKRGLERGAEP